ncbi:hypothetical protein MA16_Dca028085 [Dendrobium catenatum]|uniref:Uncharacterized protein n=1 Tax=Dendrobium catenatum TaxID=906689 RepID=A0A2I0VAS0_9ASPA|nr:hypothetical protein MA16_Dca028085 [Dendrobium catenatum]
MSESSTQSQTASFTIRLANPASLLFPLTTSEKPLILHPPLYSTAETFSTIKPLCTLKRAAKTKASTQHEGRPEASQLVLLVALLPAANRPSSARTRQFVNTSDSCNLPNY